MLRFVGREITVVQAKAGPADTASHRSRPLPVWPAAPGPHSFCLPLYRDRRSGAGKRPEGRFWVMVEVTVVTRPSPMLSRMLSPVNAMNTHRSKYFALSILRR